MKYFTDLGDRIAKAYRAADYDELRFTEIARRALEHAPASAKVTVFDVLDWVLDSAVLPAQLDPQSTFGQPPVTVYAHDRFVIDVLFWLEGTTSIHSHGFAGAFHVLHGSSIHTRWKWTTAARVNSFFQLGRATVQSIELLKTGTTRAVPAGSEFIHALFHLDRPSATVVVRTLHNPDTEPQFSYQPPSVALVSFPPRLPVPTRRSEVLKMLFTLRHPQKMRYAERALRRADLYELYVMLSSLRPLITDDEFDQLAGVARRNHGDRIDPIISCLSEMARQNAIIAKRALVQDPEHRFFLALLLNAPTQGMLLQLVKNRYPKRDPIDKVIEWLGELAQPVISPSGKDSIGIVIDASMLDVVRLMLRGYSFSGILRELKRDYDSSDVEAQRDTVRELVTALSNNSLLRPLFVTSAPVACGGAPCRSPKGRRRPNTEQPSVRVAPSEVEVI